MAKTGLSVEERRVVNAPANIVYTVLTSPADMVGWLTNEARCDARPSGIYDLRWYTGYVVHGKVKAAVKPHLLTVAWRGSVDPGETEVSFVLDERDGATEVAVRHTGFGRGARWASVIEESRKGWTRSLENLAHLVETGIDLREARRPLMGVNLGDKLDDERRAKDGIDATDGIYLAGVVGGMSAQAAGLQAHDVITTVDGTPVPHFETLVALMQGHAAGDRVEVAYVRGKQRKTISLELKPRPMPDIAADPHALLATLLERYEKARMEVVKATVGVSDERAGRRPQEGEWSAKDVIAHLCVAERDLQYALGEVLQGNEMWNSSGNPSTVPEKLAAVLSAAPTVAALLNRLHQDQSDTLAMIAALRPEIVANKARYRRVGSTVYDWPDHVHEHVEQIRAALSAR